jgi:hypothetical protein
MPTARRLNLVPLEARETPATLVDASTLTYRDVDGDSVVVKLSKPVLDSPATVASVFTFAPGPVLGGEQLRSINLTGLAANQVKGIGITVAATRSLVNGGDGFAAVGSINATGADIGDVIVDGDLGDIHAGDAKFKTSCVGVLRVNSMGRYGTGTGGTLASALTGKVGSIAVKTSIVGASVQITGDTDSKLGGLTVGGSLVGGATNRSGAVTVTGDIGLAIGGNLRGGAGDNSARVLAGGRLLSLTVGGPLIGGQGAANEAACVRAGKDISPILIKGSIDGSVRPVTISAVGSPAPLTTDVAIRSLAVRGDVVGATVLAGYNQNSQPVNADAQVGPVSVLGDWATSVLAAGVTAGGDGVFGTGDDAVIAEPGQLAAVSARIASVWIGGQATGTSAGGDGYGFVAQAVGAFYLGGVAVPLHVGIANDSLAFGSTLDVVLREV